MAFFAVACGVEADYAGTAFPCDPEAPVCPAGMMCLAGICTGDGVGTPGAPSEPGSSDDGDDTTDDTGAPGPGACGENDETSWYRDSDGDGFGDPAVSQEACEVPDGYVADATDCDDEAELVHPNATEVCGDKVDNDCVGGDPCEASLVGHWPLLETGGAQALDVTAAGNHGVLRNGASFVAGDGVVFDGVDDFVEVPTAASYSTASGTVSLWFRPDQTGARSGVWSRDAAGNGNGGHVRLGVDANSALYARIQGTDSNAESSVGPVAVGAWHHAVLTYGPAGMKIYIGGVLRAENGYTGGTQNNLEPVVFGAETRSSEAGSAQPITEPFAGAVSDVRMYDRALSATEVSQLYDVTRTGR